MCGNSVRKGILYEAKNYHNIVFVGTDGKGVPKFASMRGVFDRDGKGFKCSRKIQQPEHRLFHIHACKHPQEINLAATVFPLDRASMVALGMLADAPLETFLAQHPEVSAKLHHSYTIKKRLSEKTTSFLHHFLHFRLHFVTQNAYLAKTLGVKAGQSFQGRRLSLPKFSPDTHFVSQNASRPQVRLSG